MKRRFALYLPEVNPRCSELVDEKVLAIQRERAREEELAIADLKIRQKALRKRRKIRYLKGRITCRFRGHRFVTDTKLDGNRILLRCTRCENALTISVLPPAHFNCRSVFVPIVGDGKIEVET